MATATLKHPDGKSRPLRPTISFTPSGCSKVFVMTRWTVLIHDVVCRVGGRRVFHCWCRCNCGTHRLVRKAQLKNGESQSCGCLAKELTRQRLKDRTGKRHPRWKGGHWNRGTEAWANKLLRQSRRCSRENGYAAPSITGMELVHLFTNFSGTCRICAVEIDKWNGRKLCLDHDHKTGRVRGLICHHCNACLGWLESYRVNILAHIGET